MKWTKVAAGLCLLLVLSARSSGAEAAAGEEEELLEGEFDVPARAAGGAEGAAAQQAAPRADSSQAQEALPVCYGHLSSIPLGRKAKGSGC